jgi:hypothetical protein
MTKRTALSIMALSLLTCACSNTTASNTNSYAGSSVVGQVTALSLDSISITPGTVSEVEMSDDFMNNMPGDMQQPDSDNTQDQNTDTSASENSDGQVPDKPEGDAQGNGDMSGQTPPDKPDGDQPGDMQQPENADASSDAQVPSDDVQKPDENANADQNGEDMSNMQQPGGDMQGGDMPQGDMGFGAMSMYSFSADEDTSTATFDLSDAEYAYADLDMNEDIDLRYLYIGAVVEIEVDDEGNAAKISLYSNIVTDEQQGMNNSNVNQGTSANTIDEDATIENESYSSNSDDENALRISDATVSLDSITVDKSGGSSSNTEDGDFYGMNAALLATDGANVTLTNSTIKSDAQNGNGVFSYGTGTKVTVENTTIETQKDNSGGIQTTGGGTTIAKNLTVTTQGSSSAAIRTDRGGGTVEVSEGTYTTNGYNSPAVYSTADISVSDATLEARNSEALVIEGDNSITLTNSAISGNMSSEKGSSSNINVHNVMIYQSMSGDANEGEGSLSLSDCTLTSNNGDMFFFTNTQAHLLLNHTTLLNKGNGNLFTIMGNDASNGWGSAGSNGAQAVVEAQNQELEGDIVVDTISTLDLTLSSGSAFTGTINIQENKEGGTAVENNAVVHIAKGCSWKLTGNCTISSLDNEGVIDYNGFSITLADGTVLSE